jgi:hypothetical protein
MYTGHVAVALAARATRRDLPLWVLVVAAQGCDWAEALLDIAGAGTASSLWSHAFPFVVLAALAAGVLVALWKRSFGAALLVAAVYLSHPVADLVTGYKPLWLGGPPLGLHFIQRPVADLIVQASLCVIGWAIYVRSLPPSRPRRLLTSAPLALLLSFQAMSDLVLYARSPAARDTLGEASARN